MLEALILWQIGSARAEGKARERYATQREGQGLAIFMMGACFVATIFVWPLALGYRTQLLKKRPAIGWSTIPLIAILLLIIFPVAYFFIGLLWALGELAAFVMKNEDLFD